jgi:hypothetical protein
MTAADFFGRLRAAQALTEDFDDIVAEFGRGCPCKNPPLKSTGKAHLKSTTHDKAFNKASGKFFGMTVREAFMLPVAVVNVEGAQRIDNGGAAVGEQDNNYDMEEFDEMDADPDVSVHADAAAAAAADGGGDGDGDDDLSDIVLEDA